jgi:hypothetical protein
MKDIGEVLTTQAVEYKADEHRKIRQSIQRK